MGVGGESEARRGLVGAFARDLRWSVGAWKIDPRLPLAAFSVSLCEVAFVAMAHSTAGHILVLPWIVFFLFFAGFRGVERVWYDRIGLGWDFAWKQVRECNGDLRSRFICVGIVVFIPLVLLTEPFRHASPAVHYGVAGLAWFVADVLLTFVTVELALVTSDPGEAIGAGISLLRTTWPACALYALLPPLGLQLVIQSGAGFGTASRIVGGIVVAPIALACRGATVRFFDREVRELSLHTSPT